MRPIAVSLVKKCKLKQLSGQLPRRLSIVGHTPEAAPTSAASAHDASLMRVCDTWPADEAGELRAALLRDMRVLPDFVTPHEEAELLAELEPALRRMRYEYDHWDNAIEGYRETERAEWGATGTRVLSRVLRAAFSSPAREALPHAHVLDLAPGGHIKPHVDAVRFCGSVIAGVCLLSSAVMRLQHEARPELAARALLPRRCLYIMQDVARYSFTHAVLGGACEWDGARVVRGRRVSVILRERPHGTHDTHDTHGTASETNNTM